MEVFYAVFSKIIYRFDFFFLMEFFKFWNIQWGGGGGSFYQLFQLSLPENTLKYLIALSC